MSAWPVSSCSSRASRRRSSSCASIDAPEGVARDALGQVDGDRRARRERLGQAEVVVREARRPGRACRGRRSRRSPAPRATSGTHSPVRAPSSARDLLIDLGIVEHGVDCARSARAPARGRSSTPQRGIVRPTSPSAPSPATAAKRSSSAPAGSATATSRASSSSRSRARDRGRAAGRGRSRSRARCRPRSATRAAATSASRPRTGGRSRSRPRPGAASSVDELLVLVGEVLAALLLGQVEVAVGDAAQQDRHAEERAHRRMVRREPDRARVLARGRAGAAASPRGSARRGCRGRAAGRRSRRASPRRCRW